MRQIEQSQPVCYPVPPSSLAPYPETFTVQNNQDKRAMTSI